MYILYDKKSSLVFPNGAEYTAEDLKKSGEYDILFKVPCVVRTNGGVTSAYYTLSSLAEQYNIDLDTMDDEAAVSKINAITSASASNRTNQALSFNSVLAVAKISALTLPDEQAIEVPDLYSEYAVGVNYKSGDRFQYGGTLYKVNQAHTSQEQWVPGTIGTESLYTNLMLNDAGHQIWKQPTGAHDAYNIGDIVEYKGTLYKSLIDGNVYAPDVYPAGWETYVEE